MFDIANFAYHSGVLHEADLVERNPRLRPMQQQSFQLDQWYSVSSRCVDQ